MQTFTPAALNTPEVVFEYTAARKGAVQFYVDTTNLSGADVLNVKIGADVTGNMVLAVNDDRRENTIDPLDLSYMFALDVGNTIRMTLELKAGTLGSYNWAAVVLGNE